MRQIKNISASIKQKLLNKARNDKRPFYELLHYYAIERFLYRVSISPYQSQFILKGALMLRAWNSPILRFTKDIDFLGKTNNSAQNLLNIFRDILDIETKSDGLDFDKGSLKNEPITEEEDYVGTRLLFQGFLGKAKLNMQIDIGFGDTIFPKPELLEIPALISHTPAKLFCYSRETAIAEKFQTMIKKGETNSRMKDFYDIWLLLRQFNFVESSAQFQ